MGPLTDDERDFLREVAWSDSLGWLSGAPSTIGEVEAAADALLAQLREMHPGRPQRLLLTRVLAAKLQAEADELLHDMLVGGFSWSEVGPDDWRSVAWQAHERDWLVKLTGKSPQTIARRVKEAVVETLDAAQAAAAEARA